jgi:hypothetical protein
LFWGIRIVESFDKKSALLTIELLDKAQFIGNKSYEFKITTIDSLQKLRSCKSWGVFA